MYFRLYENIIPNVKCPNFDYLLVVILETIYGFRKYAIYLITIKYITPNILCNSSENNKE